jgi:hypothetical protein
LFFTARIFLGIFLSSLITLITIFGTSLWSTAGTTLWQHGFSTLFLALALFLILKAEKNPALVSFSFLPLFYSLIIRPMNIISLVFLSLFIFLKYRKYFLWYCLGGFLVISSVLIYFYLTRGIFLSNYYGLFLKINVFDCSQYFKKISSACLGQLFSPARGLFIYSPVILFSIFGLLIGLKKKDLFCYLTFFICLVHLGVVASIHRWWGGHCYGPRYLTDLVPYFFYYLIIFFKSFLLPQLERKKFGWLVLFVVSVLISFYMHFKGANFSGPFTWNIDPSNIDYDASRIWDWKDPPFLRN